MSQSTFDTINMALLGILVVSIFFPYQRFNIATKYATTIRIIMGVVVIAMAVARYLLY
jgi:hypothetical protein